MASSSWAATLKMSTQEKDLVESVKISSVLSSRKFFAAMPKQTRSQNQKSKANRTSHDIPEDLNKLYVKELRDLCKNLGLKQDGGRQALTN